MLLLTCLFSCSLFAQTNNQTTQIDTNNTKEYFKFCNLTKCRILKVIPVREDTTDTIFKSYPHQAWVVLMEKPLIYRTNITYNESDTVLTNFTYSEIKLSKRGLRKKKFALKEGDIFYIPPQSFKSIQKKLIINRYSRRMPICYG